jgi:hypothetical protein
VFIFIFTRPVCLTYGNKKYHARGGKFRKGTQKNQQKKREIKVKKEKTRIV